MHILFVLPDPRDVAITLVIIVGLFGVKYIEQLWKYLNRK